ncbi:MAG: hypothetical protein ACE1ZQ_02820, partial [Ignavibacteriaceae bacterium]
SNKSKEPINDEITEIMSACLNHSKKGTANYSDIDMIEVFKEGGGWRGMHRTECGQRSDNHDYQLKNGMITNSLCVFYLQYYRHVIPTIEMKKVMDLVDYYKTGQ